MNEKMCINISHDNLMCRYSAELEDEVSEKKGYRYVEPGGFQQPNDFEYWIKICLDYNSTARASKKK
ncbi:hypothetical protein [Sphingobacterium detergens]